MSFSAPAFQGVLTVSVNGAFLATSDWGRAEADVAGNIPFLVPAPLLRPGMNEFEIVLSKRGVVSAFLDRVAIGPDTLLRPNHDQHRFLFSTVQRIIDGWHITMGLSLFIIWLACRGERIFLVTSGVILSHAAVSLSAIRGDGALSETAIRLINHARVLTGCLVLPMALLFVRRPLPVPLGVSLPPPPLIIAASFLSLPVIFAAVLWGLSVVMRVAFRERGIAATALAGDALGENRVLIWRFAQTMNALDQFSQRLKSEMAAAEDALRRRFAREQKQGKAAVLEAQRVRLVSDLHAGIAGQLLSILALCELRGEASGDDLGMMLAVFRERIEPQLMARGVTLLWRASALPEVKGLNPGATLNIFRILQEVSVNVACHSGSPTLTIEAGPFPQPRHGVRLCLTDQRSGEVVSRPGSYGFGNMGRRVDALGGLLDTRSGPGGTTVNLDLPAEIRGPAAA